MFSSLKFYPVCRNLLNEAELQNVWKALQSNESVMGRAFDVSLMSTVVCLFISETRVETREILLCRSLT